MSARPAPLRPASSAPWKRSTLDLPEPVQLDCGRELHPVRVAYETYGALSPQRDNVILVCHALSGDAHAAGFAKHAGREASTRDGFAAEDRDGLAGKALGWWDGMIGPVRRSTPTASSSSPPTCWAVAAAPPGRRRPSRPTGQPYGPDFPVITVADMTRTERAFLDVLGSNGWLRWQAGPWAGCRRSSGRSGIPTRLMPWCPSPAHTPCIRRAWPGTRSRVRRSCVTRPWQGGRYDGTGRKPDGGMGVARMVGHITYLSAPALNDKFGRRLAVQRRHPLHAYRAGVPGRKLPAAPGGLVRPALRRQHLPVHVARADVFRSRAAVRRRIAPRELSKASRPGRC